MSEIINVYCDESCHLENDHQTAMILGAVWCRREQVSSIAERIKEIKHRHGFGPEFEAKWTKVSQSKIELYLDLIDYFFDDDDLHARALIIPDKSILDHEGNHQSHDDWYYKMYFTMLKVIIDSSFRYHFYLDIKDTQGREKVAKLHDVLATSQYDFEHSIIEKIQLVRSHEVQLIQITDLIIGAISYVSRGLSGNKGKEALIDRIVKRSGLTLRKSTLYKEQKLNILRWIPREQN